MVRRNLFFCLAVFLLAVALAPAAAGAPDEREPYPLPAWSSEVVAGGIPGSSALALDSDGTPHLLYYRPSTGHLLYTHGGQGAWQTEVVTTLHAVELELAIALAADGTPHIAYIDADHDQLVAGHRQQDHWTLQTISGAGHDLSLAAGSDGVPQLLVVQGDALRYWRGGGVWTSEPVGTEDIWLLHPRLALDEADRAHVAYTPGVSSIYAERDSLAWKLRGVPFELVEALAIGPDGQPRLLYSEEEVTFYGRYPDYTYWLKLATRHPDGWRIEDVSLEYYPYDSARLAVDALDRAHIIYRDELNRFVYLRREGYGGWRFERPAPAGEGDVSLAVTPAGKTYLLTHADGRLILSTRQINLLDRFSFLPLLAG